MSIEHTPPVTLERVASAVEAAGLIPFVAAGAQVAGLLPNRAVRIILPEGHPAQGVADYPRFFHASYAAHVAQTVRELNASTYLPKVTFSHTQEGMIALHLQHTFNWVAGASEAQLNAEVQQFIMATIAMMNQLDVIFPDQWAKEEPHA